MSVRLDNTQKVLSADFTGGGEINQDIFLAKAVVRLYMNSNFRTFGFGYIRNSLGSDKVLVHLWVPYGAIFFFEL